MGNGIRRIPDGLDFSHADFASQKDFGFTGSSQGYDEHSVAPPFAGSRPTDNGKNLQPFAEGGEVGGSAHSFAKGGHPHGHKVVRVHHDPSGGGVIMHHAHGGYTMCHADGGMTHHGHDGQPVMSAAGGDHHPGEGTFLERARGGDVAQDKALVAKGVHQHEDNEHGGEHTDLALAKGGRFGHKVRLPRGMRPKAAHATPIGSEPAMNRPPRNLARNPTTRNAMPGGEMGYGVEPGSEPDRAGTEQGIPQLRRGGRMPFDREA